MVLVEAAEFHVFGIMIRDQDILKIRSAMANAYRQLMKKSNRWADTGFCKREIANLWDSIIDMLSRISESPHLEVGPNEIRTLLITNEDNQQFLVLLGEELKKSEALNGILNQFREISLERGSLRISFKDPLSQEKTQARIDVTKMLGQVRRESDKIKNGLKYFVDWVRENKRTLLTCSLAAGVLIISLAAIGSVGFMVENAKLLIMAAIAIICTISNVYGTYGIISDLARVLRRKLGFSISTKTSIL
jgi:hypothetical protein